MIKGAVKMKNLKMEDETKFFQIKDFKESTFRSMSRQRPKRLANLRC